jgi:HSP20 family protein
MALFRWSDRPDVFRPFEELEREMTRLQSEMSRLFGGVVGSRPFLGGVGVFPPLNVSEDADNIFVRAELPGVSPNEIDIMVEGNTLTLRGERKLPEAEKEVSYHRRERDAGRFSRSLTLPTRIEADKVEASFKNGVLTIRLPKAAEARPKQIAVKVAA